MEKYSVKKRLYEDFLETNSSVLNVLKRKANKYPFFNSQKLLLDSVDEEESKNRLDFINITFDYLSRNIKGKEKDDLKLKDFIENNFSISKADWSSLFIKSCFLSLIKRNKIKNELFKDVVSTIGINPNKFNLDDYIVKEEEKVLPGDIVAWKVESDTIYIHYGVLLYEDNDIMYCLEPNVDKLGKVKEGFIHLLKRNKSDSSYKFMGVYNIFSTIYKKKKGKSKRVIKKDGTVTYKED
jgi:hypothetical protein